MATRFYLNISGWPQVRPAADAGWENGTLTLETSTSRRMMYPWRGSSIGAINATGIDNQAAVHDLLMAQYISEPLAAQTISGTIRAVIQALESSTSANMRSQMHAWVMAPDGSVRGTLTTFTTGALANEWATTRTSRFFPVGSSGTTVTNVSCTAGDRIVVELGARIHDTSASVYSGHIKLTDGEFNSPGTDWDLPDDQTNTNTFRNGWIEFSANLTFQVADTTISDSISGAPDVMPAAESTVIARIADISTFTTESDDPTDIGTYNDSGDLDFTGWVKLVGPAGGARVKVYPTSGLALDAIAYLFDETPVAGSTVIETAPDRIDFTERPQLMVDVPEGETRWICVQPVAGSFQTFEVGDTNVQLIVTRQLSGDLSDSIADAPDALPATEDSSVTLYQRDLEFFTVEDDDPDYLDTEWSARWYTTWFKLVVPASGIKVNIDTFLPIDELGIVGTAIFVFDEVPTASSVPIAEAVMENTETNPPTGSIDQEWMSKAKVYDLELDSGTTYYVAVVPYDWDVWFVQDTLNVTIYRHFDSATVVEDDVSADAVIRKVIEPPVFITAPTYVDASSATTAGSSFLTIPMAAGVQQGDLALAVLSAHTPVGTVSTPSGWTFLGTIVSGSTHRLSTYYRYVDDPSTGVTITATGAGAKAGSIIVFRNASTPVIRSDFADTTANVSAKGTQTWFAFSNDPNYLSDTMQLFAWASTSSTVATWTPHASITERKDFGVSLAGLMLATKVETLDNLLGGTSATPSQATVNLNQVIQIQSRTTTLRVSAEIESGGYFEMNAVVVDSISTRHDRTRYHFDMTPLENIYSTLTYGAFPPGTDLQEVLEGLDELISDLESGNQ